LDHKNKKIKIRTGGTETAEMKLNECSRVHKTGPNKNTTNYGRAEHI
jgi:hypothetical protein